MLSPHPTWLVLSLICLLSYFLGCLNTGYYLVKMLTKQDIRDHASGNAGSRNAGRVLGKRGFAITLLGDAGKGALAIWLTQQLGGNWESIAALCAAIIGHIWPLQLNFRGGKGLATLLGGLLLLKPWLLAAACGLALLFIALPYTRPNAGLLTLLCSPALLALEMLHQPSFQTLEFCGYSFALLLVLSAHRENFRQSLFSTRPSHTP